ncbi:hypothetical protein DCMF_16695 [Candidatus Formimonas warabiya]|uniref:EamA domain-containing protein n=1 Tax=Formimonas warabiya TaxID=1761012 RepID=A0A3G1L1Z4_FORW1|nr:hypothetical protein DCMF_16695 [Candidatus Formimonas warabiya]
MHAKAQQKKSQLEIAHAKKGLLWAVSTGATWGLNGILLSIALVMPPFTGLNSLYAAPLVGAAINDGAGGILLFFYNLFTGKFLEYGRTLRTRPGMIVCLASLFGGPLAMSAYLIGINLAGPMYTLAITSMFPAVGAILAVIILKEKVVPRVWFGILLCITGAVVVGYIPPTGNAFPHFYLGIGMAIVAALGWALEGVLATYGMDMVDPEVCAGIREATSFVVYLVAIIPLGASFALFGSVFKYHSFWWLCLAGASAAASYIAYYKALNMTGAARATGLNISYALWGVIFGWLILHSTITANLIIGALVITFGGILVVANPKEMVNLRKV